jgi:hypothetical protein
MGENKNAYTTFVGKPEGKRLIVRRRCKWVDNIKMHLKVITWSGMDWIQIGTSGWIFLNKVMTFRVPLNVEKFLNGCTTLAF